MKIILLIVMVVSMAAQADQPEWTRHTERRIAGSDIIHWGMGQAETEEVALFKARHMAIKTLIEECGGIANKEIIPRKQYAELESSGYHAWALVSLDFDACQAAKAKDGKRLENAKLAEDQKTYQKLSGLNPSVDLDEIKKLQQELSDSLRSSAEIRQEQIGALRNDISALRGELRQGPPQVVPAQLPATNTMKVQCDAQYQSMRSQLMRHAQQYNGNIAAPELFSEYNAMRSQGSMCSRMQ